MDVPFFKNLPASTLALFKEKETSVVGIDFGSSSLKMVQLKKVKERAVLQTYGELALGPYGGGEIGKTAKLVDQKAVEMIKDLMKEANITSRHAVVSIPLRSSFITLASFPVMSDKDLNEAIPYEARRYIPVPTSEVLMDWWVLPPGISGWADKDEGFAKERKFSEVLLVAIHRDVVEKYQNILKEAGMESSSFEIEAFSQVRSLLSREVAPVLIVDLGASSAKVTLVDYGIVRLAHNIDRGFQDLTQALSRALGVDFERAEKLKRDTGLSDRPEHKEIVSVVRPLLEYIFSESLKVATEYRRRSNHSIKRVILTGGGANLKGILEFSINKFGVETKLANPFGKVQYPAFLEPALKEIGPSFSTALGLGLRELQE